VIGVWVDLSDPRPSSIISGTRKWIGPLWGSIGPDMVLTLTPTKTEKTTRARVKVDLTKCPLVMECLAGIAPEKRGGPLVISDRTGLPFWPREFDGLWRRVTKAAGLRPTLWNRDLRAGGLTEASMAGASSDDRAKLAAHSKRMTQATYDRDILISSDRVAEARARFRGLGNDKEPKG
jgi:hypothetical protein